MFCFCWSQFALVVALALVLDATPAVTTTPPFPLIEASGSNANGHHITLGRFCGNNETFALAVNTTSGDVAVMRGPTPHVVARGSTPALVGATVLLAADVAPGQGDDLVVGVGDGKVVLITMEVKEEEAQRVGQSAIVCTGRVAVRSTTENVGAVAGLAQLPPLPTSAGPTLAGVLAVVQETTETENPSEWGAVLRWVNGAFRVTSRTTLGLPPAAVEGCTWSGAASVIDRTDAVGAPSGAAPLLVLCCTEDATPQPATPTFPVRTFAFALDGSGGTAAPELLGSHTAALANPLLAVVVADFYGDGAPLAMLVDDHSNAELYWLTAGGAALLNVGSFTFETNVSAGRKWQSVATGSLLPLYGGASDDVHSLRSERQLLALREARTASSEPSRFEVGLLLYARPAHWLRRAASFANLRGTQEFKIGFNDSAANTGNLSFPLNTTELTSILESTHANTFGFYVCDCTPSPEAPGCSKANSYLSFVQMLEASKSTVVDGVPMRVWLGLLPPTEALMPAPSECRPPPNSPLTTFDESKIFGAGGNYTDYSSWGALVGLLSKQYPHLTAVDIDDFSVNVLAQNGAFTGDSVAMMLSNIRRESPQVALASVMYDDFTSFPDLALVLDSPVYFFRNAKQGAGPCAAASCVWGPRHQGSKSGCCLAGVCSEPTTYNVAEEIAQVSAGMPPGRRVVVGYYATQHSTLGQPTPRYVSRLLQTIATQPNVGGVVTYTLKDARQGCKVSTAPLYGMNQNPAPATSPLANSTVWAQHQLGCIVRDQYAAIAGADKL